ncbi:PREDICTED: histone-lysine N-methyltransferase SETMAR-like [Atta cephalotes]|uniref:Mos1 transposase HTH domain-containing protein n=1 Tax=Atta cephalotes TaxID=12957 RepID=A0A158N995_ATTCE|nr:PREDICTED: histone-lysine N-methyltransferase SETMAR-like [Atta cephalotes]
MLGNCFGSDTLKKTAVYEWHERFKSGSESVEDDERSGRPSTSKTDENINKDIVVNGLGFRVAAKLVPKELNFKKKGPRCHRQRHDFQAESDPTFIKRIITGDEMWVYEYDTQSKHQASEWKASNESRPKKITSFSVEKESDVHDFHGLQRLDPQRLLSVPKPQAVAFQGKRLNEEIIAETEAYFEGLDVSYYRKDIEMLENRYIKCIALEGNYVELYK